MDTSWFGVDAEGHVALFDTGEGGGVPQPLAGARDELLDSTVLRAAHAVVGLTEPRFEDPKAAQPARIGDSVEDRLDEGGPSEFGLYHYGEDETLYRRLSSPSRPLLFEQLPEELRRKIPSFRLPEVSFADKPALQLEEYADAIDYYGHRSWYESEDGTMACARRGHEREFRALFRTDADWIPLQEARARESEVRRARAPQDRPLWLLVLLGMLLLAGLAWALASR
jgi:hypothetical protein